MLALTDEELRNPYVKTWNYKVYYRHQPASVLCSDSSLHQLPWIRVGPNGRHPAPGEVLQPNQQLCNFRPGQTMSHWESCANVP